MDRTARAYAPGSVTALFAPADAPTNSLGVSVAIADGVESTVEPAGDTRVTLDGNATAFEPVELALDALGVTADVALRADVPVGCGFGASGAATLSTVLAANEAFDLGASRDGLVQTAAAAEIQAGTGLGDVFVQAGGGLVTNDGAGLSRRTPTEVIEYESYGGIETSAVLGDDGLMARIRTEGTASVRDLPQEPSLAAVIETGWEFARAIGLPTPDVAATVDAVEDAGGVASMAMVGETVFAVGVEGVLANRTTVATEGAHVR